MPYFARYAYEVYVAPKRTVPERRRAERHRGRVDFAEALSHVLVRFDNLWSRPFPYVMALHQAPTDGGDHRASTSTSSSTRPCGSPTCSSTSPGPEIGGGNFLTDTSPEEKAAELRALPGGSLHARDDRRGASSRSRSSRSRRRFAIVVVAACEHPRMRAFRAWIGTTRGDTIYAVDRVSEERLSALFEERVAPLAPLVLIAEGLPPTALSFPAGG